MSDYSLSSKVLHYLALSNPMVRKMAFDMDCLACRSNKKADHVLYPPVFISGLARGGTTILLEALYSSGIFKTLTYRNMPFVTAPFLWNMLTASHYKRGDLKERAHGDRLYVGFDSPEAFEEVFWLTFTDSSYVLSDCLVPHMVDEDVVAKYRQFVANVTTEREDGTIPVYLAKNNNNVLRIDSLKKAFPDSLIIVPFRKPLAQAKSLLNQHRRFKQTQKEDGFALRYMTWLGHFEFGLNFKPFRFSDDALPENAAETDKLSYWLRYWKSVYEFMMQNHAQDILLFDYDKFCSTPASVLENLASKLNIEKKLLSPFSEKIQSPTRYPVTAEEEMLLEPVQDIYEELRSWAL